jgi:hypothetical protein
MNDRPLPLTPKQKERLLEIAKERIATLEDEVAKRTEERDAARTWIQTLQERKRVLTCAFCGTAYPPGTPASNVETLTKHVAACPKHPMVELRVALSKLLFASREIWIEGSNEENRTSLSKAQECAEKLLQRIELVGREESCADSP